MRHNEKAKNLVELVNQFDVLMKSGSLDLSSEATARSWIEGLLGIFGWNSRDPYEVDQEVNLSQKEIENLGEIDSKHRRPDYLLCAKTQSLIFIDAKKIDHDIKENKKSSFQIRSYGWSAGHSYAILTNFKEFAIYDCRFKPNKEQAANVARVFYTTYDKFLDNFASIFNHLDKDFVLSGQSFDPYKLTDRPIGTLTLDEDFSEHIREWRLKFANSIYLSSSEKSIEFVSEATQILIDRIIFCRVAEGLKVIEAESLLRLANDNSPWKKIKLYFSSDCFDKFGGPIFNDRRILENFSVSNELILKFIETLYYPNPYRFDVITPVLLGNIYERYLGRKLEIKGSKIVDDFKEEYQKTKGAVYTPDYVVRAICEKTIGPLAFKKTPSEIKSLKILDPSCGSGSFLLGVFDFLSEQLVDRYSSGKLKEAEKKWFWSNPRTGKSQLRIFAKRELINSCIHGVDIDAQATEVARLSLSLKALESASLEPIALRELGMLDSMLLDGIGGNIKLGNSLVDSRVFQIVPEVRADIPELKRLKVFDWNSENNFKIAMESGGFDAIVGNPPYIEIKHYKKNSPIMHKYLSESEDYDSCGSGKTDISMPFIERSLELLKPNGRLGFIIQSRFFKTDYGRSARKMISSSRNLESILDFGSLRVFEKRTTYTCIMILSKSDIQSFSYTKIDSLSQIIRKLNDAKKFNLLNFSTDNQLGDDPWFFVQPDLRNLRSRMLASCGTFESLGDRASINVGLQVLYKKIYLIRGQIKKGKIVGQNFNGDVVQLEDGSCRPLALNRKFFAYKNIEKENFALFPYEIVKASKSRPSGLDNLQCQSLSFTEFNKKYPLAGKYLAQHKSFIQDNVSTNTGVNWIHYTREQNHCLQSLPKILIPSTCLDTSATVDAKGEFYQDNVRVNSIVIDGATNKHYQAVAAVLNSRIFDCLAKITAESLDNGYIQLNKQFLNPVPIPVVKILSDAQMIETLSNFYNQLNQLSNSYAMTSDRETKVALGSAIKVSEENLNQYVNEKVYSLSKTDISLLNKYSTRLNLAVAIDQQVNELGELSFIEDAEAS